MHSWIHRTVTTAQADSGYGTVLMTTGDNPRILSQLAAWKGTNTTAVTWCWFVVPGTAGTPDANNQIDVTSIDMAFPLGNVDATIDAATITIPLTALPFATKGAGLGGPPCVIPPNSYLCGGPGDVNLNGTVVMQCISYEIEC